MKILYALPATGNGHVSRAIELYPYLSQLGEIDFLISGTNANLFFPFPVKYRSAGISLFYSKGGGIDYVRCLKQLRLPTLIKEINALPVHQYDWVISDFEPLSAWACARKKKPAMQWGHQASFFYDNTPRPPKREAMGEWILKKYTPGTIHAGIHFQPYHPNVSTPVIKKEVYTAHSEDKGHISVYLQHYTLQTIVEVFSKKDLPRLQIFHHEIMSSYQIDNMEFYPITTAGFAESMRTCAMVITGGGFETPAEALYLGKKLVCTPIKQHYEQACNAAALSEIGVHVHPDLNDELIRTVQELADSNARYRLDSPFVSSREIVSHAIALYEDMMENRRNTDIDFSAVENLFC